MTGHSLVQAVLIILMVVATIVAHHWPRDGKGKWINLEQFQRWLDLHCIKEPPKSDGQSFYIGLFVLVALLAVALR